MSERTPGGGVRVRLALIGPAGAGKATALRSLLRRVPPSRRGTILPRDTQGDITLSIELNLGRRQALGGRPLRVELVTVNGEITSDSTLSTLLTGVAGVLFLADSDPGARERNVEAWSAMLAAFEEGVVEGDPLLRILANKRDLEGALAVGAIAKSLGMPEEMVLGTVAVSGHGLFQALLQIVREIEASMPEIVAANPPTHQPGKSTDEAQTDPVPSTSQAPPAVSSRPDVRFRFPGPEPKSGKAMDEMPKQEGENRSDLWRRLARNIKRQDPK